MRHQDHLSAAQSQHAGYLRKLIVVADDRAHFTAADVEHDDVPAALVVIHLVARQVQLPLLADVAIRSDQHLRVVDDVAFFLAQPDRQHQTMTPGQLG